jgi:hypothetical protein
MKYEYIIQEQIDKFEYSDIISVCSLPYARKYYAALKLKYPNKNYRIVRWSMYV